MDEELKKPLGRPPSKSVADIQNAQVRKAVKLTDTLLEFAETQIAKLILDSEGITNIEQRTKVVESTVKLIGDLTKTTKVTAEQVDKNDKDDKEGEKFNLDKFIEETKK